MSQALSGDEQLRKTKKAPSMSRNDLSEKDDAEVDWYVPVCIIYIHKHIVYMYICKYIYIYIVYIYIYIYTYCIVYI